MKHRISNVVQSVFGCFALLAIMNLAMAQGESTPPAAGIPGNSSAQPKLARPTAPIQPERDGVSRESTVDVLPSPTLNPGFGVPTGLKTPSRRLFHDLGYGSEVAFPLTPITCFDAAFKCYTMGLHEDALAFVNHGLKLCNHARLFLLKAMLEIDLGRPDDATNTLVKFRHAAARPAETYGMQTAIERLNGPARVRADLLLKAWQYTP